MDTPIAIVGMSCRFAGCASLAQFWDAVMSRKSMLTVPGSDAELPFGSKGLFGRPYPVRIGQLGDLYSCVPSMQHFPRQVNSGENQDLYFSTQLAFDALADASMRIHSIEPFHGTVRLGYAPPFNSSTMNWLQHTFFLDQTMEIIRKFMPNAPDESVEAVKAKLKESLPEPNSSSFLLGSGYRFASWIARECSFSGAATILDAGILSGAAAIMSAAEDLRLGHADVALAGAVTPPLGRAYLEGLAGEMPFSTRTELHPFSQDPCGTIPGEGGAFFVMKRREDALRSHDRIYALVKGISIGHNPADDPSAVLAGAMESSGADAATVGLVEADGSGIAELEAREIDAVQRLWGEHRPGGHLVGIGSVKGNIGHTLRASMAAGVVKAALALHYRVLPPQVQPERVTEKIANLASSAYLLTEARPWISGDPARPRRAAVISSNLNPRDPVGTASKGGRAAAMILEEEPEVQS